MSNARILIVEDESLIAEELRERLQRIGYTVVATVPSGIEAIAKVEELEPDLVLMDIRLKGQMDGIEAAAVIRDRFDIPIVYLTAHSDAISRTRAQETVPFGYLVKPITERELTAAVEVALDSEDLE